MSEWKTTASKTRFLLISYYLFQMPTKRKTTKNRFRFQICVCINEKHLHTDHKPKTEQFKKVRLVDASKSQQKNTVRGQEGSSLNYTYIPKKSHQKHTRILFSC